MTEHRPDLDDLAVLVLVAQTGSIGAAATRLGLTQPSTSRRLAALERRLGVPVLQRSHRGTALTPAGRAVVDWASALLGAADDFSRAVQTLRSQEAAGVDVAVSMTIAEHHAPRWLAVLRQRRPDSVVSLTVANSTEVVELVRDGRVDIGFIESPSIAGGLRSRRVGRDDLVVAVRPDHRWASADSVTATDLAQTRLLVRETGSGTRETVERALSTQGLRLSPGLEMASNTALTSAAVAGMGPVVISRLAVADELASGRLVQVLVEDLTLSRPLTAVWRRESRPTHDAQALVAIAGEPTPR